jgi:hypothetical protein
VGAAEDIQRRMTELTDFINETDQQVRDGHLSDLTGLDEEVASLCDRALALPPAQAVTIQPLMAKMISSLESLAKALEEFQNNLKTQGGA